MTPDQFVSKWKRTELRERAASQEHFLDLCNLVGHPTPAAADPMGEWFCFDRGATKVGGGEGWADVWMRGHFGWEYKGKRKDLDAALVQLQRYALALENPPLLVVSDLDRIEIHTNWTNTVHQAYRMSLEDLAVPENVQRLRWLFTEPERLRPDVTTEQVTKDAAERFAKLAQRLRDRDHPPQKVAHFLNRIVFCLFAEDAGLLPARVFHRALDASRKQPAQSAAILRQLFGAMQKGGLFGVDVIEWFNGGLFDSDETLPLLEEDITEIAEVAKLDWSAIEPSIFGTLFERGLDPSKRSQLGAHYTDAVSIMRIVNPVIVEPLMAEWAAVKGEIEQSLAKAETAKTASARTRASNEAVQRYQAFLHRLAEYRVLDPACGSGNFLYLALQSLKDIEHRAALEAEALGIPRGFTGMNVGVQCVRGIEINTYAAELARLTVWIGEIQWMLKHGIPSSKNPILKSLETIACRDAVLSEDGLEPDWPAVDAIVGNPPFLGGKMMRTILGDEYVERLFARYAGRVPAEADLVTYWLEKARDMVEKRSTRLVGLVATNSVRGGASRRVLDAIAKTAPIFEAWSDEEWVNEGAAVRVSLVCFGRTSLARYRLDGREVPEIYPDLTAGAVNLTVAKRLVENLGVAFMGDTKGGPFEVSGATARSWLSGGGNPNGRPNSDVLRPWINGLDLTRRPRDMWIIDFGWVMDEPAAASYEAPFEFAYATVRPERVKNQREEYRQFWWRHARPRPAMWKAIASLARCIVTPTVSKHRIFAWSSTQTCPDHQLIVIARSDDCTFGILHSRVHEVWSLALGTWLGVGNDPRYTPTTTFETFPFPAGLMPDLNPDEYSNPNADAIAAAAKKLDDLRENWINPPDWVDRVPESVPGYSDRIIAKPGREAELKKRTLTNLYNAKPAWLVNAHRELDAAVAAAYRWTDYTPEMPDDEILRRLLVLNLERSGIGAPG